MSHQYPFTVTIVAAALLVSPVRSQQPGEEPPTWVVVADLMKLMPADQLTAIKKREELAKLRAEAEAEKNGLKRKEMLDKLAPHSKRFQEFHKEWTQKIQKEGLKDWVGVLTEEVSADKVTVFVPRSMHLRLEIDGMQKDVKDAVKTLRKGDFVRFTVVVPKLQLTYPQDHEMREGLRTVESTVAPGRGVKKIEKIGQK